MKKEIVLMLAINLIISALGYSQNTVNSSACIQLNPEDFHKVVQGKQVDLFLLKNGDLTAAITNYGGRIVSLCAPDSKGQKADVVLGFKSIDDYLKAKAVYHGAIIGRTAGRIYKGEFEIEGKKYALPLNGGSNQQHGGAKGFYNQVWNVESVSDTSIVLSYISVDGEMGYPGNLKVKATYHLTSSNELTLKFTATTDKSTPINLTNHAFFNLAGEGNGTVLNHVLTIPSKLITPVNTDKIATGEFLKVSGTPFDFRKGKAIGKDLVLENSNEQLKITGGYDQSYILKKNRKKKIILAATVVEPNSGRKLDVLTDNLSIHFFSSNFFDGSDIGKLGKPFKYRESFALETQNFTSSLNRTEFPSIILEPGETYENNTTYRFSTIK